MRRGRSGSAPAWKTDRATRWLNPPEWVDWVDEPVPGYPKRPVPRDEDAAKALKKRTLTNLYNARPQWLAHAHAALDAAALPAKIAETLTAPAISVEGGEVSGH